jgi:hypothetical protein
MTNNKLINKNMAEWIPMNRLCCGYCGNDEVLFDAYVNEHEKVINVFDNSFCLICDGESTPLTKRAFKLKLNKKIMNKLTRHQRD